MSANIKRRIDPDIFKAYIKERGLTIRQLASLCETHENTIRRCLKDAEVTLTIGIDLCRTLDCDFDELFGKDDSVGWARSIDILKRIVR